jgi:hypothetical protein
MKVTFIDPKLRRHCVELQPSTVFASITTELKTIWPIPSDFFPILVYDRKLLSEDKSLGSISYHPGKCILFVGVKVSECSAQGSMPPLRCSSTSLAPLESSGALVPL